MPKNSVPPLSESAVKGQICDFLDVKMAGGSLYWDRLNSGNILAVYGDKKRRIRLCREGTADLIVLTGYTKTIVLPETMKAILKYDYVLPPPSFICRVIYLEVKGPKGKLRDEQIEFSILVEKQGAEYYVVHSLEDVMEIL